MFAGRTELRQGTWSVFTRNANKTSAEWTYMGEYENTLAGTMTKEQFIWQSDKVSCIFSGGINEVSPSLSV